MQIRAGVHRDLAASIPSLFIREIRVVRFKPKRAAAPSAPPTRPLVSFRSSKILPWSSNFSMSAGGKLMRASVNSGTDIASLSVGDRTTARSTRFSSSRTFPGQCQRVSLRREAAGQTKLTDLQSGQTIHLAEAHAHDGHTHTYADGHTHSHTHGTVLNLEQEILAKNNRLAERNRGWLAGRNILALNLVSSPGAGKTTLLERTIRELGGELSFAVIEGDQADRPTTPSASRPTGCRVVQINTGTGCHLDAAMMARGLQQLDPPLSSVVMIENVGNLVCPALFDLGERAKVVIVSVTEGDDKPIKYPHMFRASELMLLNKIDLLPYVSFDVERCLDYARQVNPRLQILQVSATRGDGLDEWYQWLRQQVGGRGGALESVPKGAPDEVCRSGCRAVLTHIANRRAWHPGHFSVRKRARSPKPRPPASRAETGNVTAELARL